MTQKTTALGLAYWAISFFGWLYETLLFSLVFHSDSDRGFLSLPFCLIYGTTALFVYLLLGTPTSPRFWKGRGAFVRWGGYYVCSALAATAAELLFGALFDRLGAPLWSYAEFPFTFRGYIALGPSLLWGTLLTTLMGAVFEPFLRLLARLPRPLALALFWLLTAFAAVDAYRNFSCLFATGRRLVFPFG